MQKPLLTKFFLLLPYLFSKICIYTFAAAIINVKPGFFHVICTA